MPAFRKYHQRTIDRVHLLIRLELANPLMSVADVARLAGLPPVRASILRATPIYKAVHNQYFSGIVHDLDIQVKDTLKLTQNSLSFAVPLAMQEIVKQALSAKDERVRNKACNDILDRDGHFAKVTRVGLATGDQGGAATERDNKVAQEMLKAIAETNKPTINSTPITNIEQ